jgi:lipid A 3-O-deacylase
MANRNWTRAAAAALGVFASAAGHAMDWRPDAVEVMAGAGTQGTATASAGLVWDWSRRIERRGLFTAQTELILSQWGARAVGGGHQGLQQIALVPVLRIVPDRGHAPWFFEVGIGASWLDHDYVTPDKAFSTRWNFYDTAGLGYRFDAKQEVGVRFVHVSNAGVRQPNPGQGFLLLRYAFRF